MKLINKTMGALGLAAALAMGATSADAQERVRVQKDYGQVVRDTMTAVLVRVDTTYVDRVVVRVDTVYVQERVEVPVPVRPEGMDFYWGFGGGLAVPQDGLEEAFDTGWNASLLAGWRSQTSPWGVRLEGMYNQLNGGTVAGFQVDDASVISAMANATLDFPWGRAEETRSGFYLTGGVGLHRFGGFDIDDEDLDPGNDIDESELLTESTTDFGVNAGAGLRFGLGGASMFLEGRWINVFTEGNNTRYVPVVLGITF